MLTVTTLFGEQSGVHYVISGALVRNIVGIEVVELNAVLVENAAQRDHSVGDLEVLELVHLVHRRVVLLLHVAVLRLQQDRLRRGQQLVVVLYFLLVAHLLLNFRELCPF